MKALPIEFFEKYGKETNLSYEKPISRLSDRAILIGERNSSLTRIAGHLINHGFNEKGIQDTLSFINRNHCQSPLDDSEIKSISKSINRYRNKTKENLVYLSAEEIDKRVSKISNEPKMDFDALPEIFKDYLKWAKDSTHGPDEFIILGYLSALGTCLGKNVVLKLSENMKVYPSTWISCIADSSRGKTSSLEIAFKLLQKIDQPLKEKKKLSEEEYKHKLEKHRQLQNKKNRVEDISYSDKPQPPKTRSLLLPAISSIPQVASDLSLHYASGVIFVSTELAVVLKDWIQERNQGMAHFYMSLFDNPSCMPEISYKNSESLPLIKNPVVSIIGASTKKSFINCFSNEHRSSGQLQRFLVAYSGTRKDKIAIPKARDSEKEKYFLELMNCLFNIHQYFDCKENEEISFKLSDEATEEYQARYDNWTKLLDELEDEDLEACISRLQDTYILKFALIIEASKMADKLLNSPSTKVEELLYISKETIVESFKLAIYFRDGISKLSTEIKESHGKHHKIIMKIIKYFRKKGITSCTEKSLKDYCNGYRNNSGDYDKAIEALIESGILAKYSEANSSNNGMKSEKICFLEKET